MPDPITIRRASDLGRVAYRARGGRQLAAVALRSGHSVRTLRRLETGTHFRADALIDVLTACGYRMTVTIEPIPDARPLPELTGQPDDVVGALQSCGPMTIPQLCKALKCSPDAARRWVERLVQSGDVTMSQPPTGKPGRRARV